MVELFVGTELVVNREEVPVLPPRSGEVSVVDITQAIDIPVVDVPDSMADPRSRTKRLIQGLFTTIRATSRRQASLRPRRHEQCGTQRERTQVNANNVIAKPSQAAT